MSDDDAPLPPFVLTDADRVRWENAQRVAETATGEPRESAAVWQAARVIYHDRETYPD